MKCILILLIVSGLLVLVGCTNLTPPAKTATEVAQELVDKIVEILNDPDFEFPDPNSSPTEFVELALNFIYVPQTDRNDSEVFLWTEVISQFVGAHFTKPSTVTSAKVVSTTEYDVGKPNGLPPYFNVLNDPPNFVEKVYTLNLKCETTDGTITSVTLPMITVSGEDQGYFYTIFLKPTDSATTVRMYPILSLL